MPIFEEIAVENEAVEEILIENLPVVEEVVEASSSNQKPTTKTLTKRKRPRPLSDIAEMLLKTSTEKINEMRALRQVFDNYYQKRIEIKKQKLEFEKEKFKFMNPNFSSNDNN